MSDADPFKYCPSEFEFPPVGPENFVRLAQDSSQVYSTLLQLNPSYGDLVADREYISSISGLISRGATSPTRLSSAEAAAPTETSHQTSFNLWHPQQYSSWHLWFRLYTHALLLESHIFPNMELYDGSLDYTPSGFTDVWKGTYRGNSVCIKAVRQKNPIDLRETKQTFRRRHKSIPHPNVLPIIDVSETLFPFCIMSPWMPDGNITQYTEMNPSANRLMLLAHACLGLIHLHKLDIPHGYIAPNNILITQDGQACLADFGIGVAFVRLRFEWCKSETIRYMAPERFPWGITVLHGIDYPSKEGDIYSVAMTSFKILTGVLPYDGRDNADVVANIKLGKRPSRPTDPNRNKLLQDPVWDTIATCWSSKPEERSKLSLVYRVLSEGGRQEAQNVELGQQRRGRFLPRIASLFQFLQESEPEIQKNVREMDKRLEDRTISERERLKLLNKLCKTCSRHRVIPKSMQIPDCSKGSVEAERGGFANVSQGTYQGRRVAIKVIRVCLLDDPDVILSRFCREGVAWKHLRHSNILPLLGVTISERRFAMVSEWMEHGNINQFVEKNKHVNRIELLVDVARGLMYMHNLQMVHGDLKGANILINKNQRACLADFGLSTITGVATRTIAGASQASLISNHPFMSFAAGASQTSLISNDSLVSFAAGGTCRWMSPELLDPELFGVQGDRPTRRSDCYALGMVIYEVLCGHYPYVETRSDIMIIRMVTRGIRPEKPEAARRLGFNDNLWRSVELCWLEDRNARPSVEDIHSSLNDATAFWSMRNS